MSGNNGNRPGAPPLRLPNNVPIIGQPKPVTFSIGGYELGFGAEPDQVGAAYQQFIASGNQPDIGFVLHWQRSAMHFRKVDEELAALRKRCAALESLLADLAGAPEAPGSTEGSADHVE